MKSSGKAAGAAKPTALTPVEKLFALITGGCIGTALLKLGNPVIFDRMILPPGNLSEFVFASWPPTWGYALVIPVFALAFKTGRLPSGRTPWPILSLAVWLVWQFLSQAQSEDKPLSTTTVAHFAACAAIFAVGWCGLGRVGWSKWFWVPVILAFVYILIGGFDQHYGGLESTRQEFYKQANWQLYPKEYLLKIQSDRIFSTLVYPNAFAGAILLLLPIILWKLWETTARWPRIGRAVTAGVVGYMAAACLYWTGSKGGWLIALILGLVLLLHLKMPGKAKTTLITASLVLGLVFFFLRFSGYFQKGATSVSARFTYWQAAVQTVRDKPVFGTGPGTFALAYRKVKPPEAEMAKLTHNDFLEQASDSGIIGGLSFAGFVLGSLYFLYRKRPTDSRPFFLIWLGLLGWAIQSLLEFGLYIPAISWPVFLFFGFLWTNTENRQTTDFR